MISYIRGELVSVLEDRIILENQGIGYQIFVPGSLLSQVSAADGELTVHTYLYVREDALSLYGFLTSEDLHIFRLLLGVSGIGPKGALGILSTITPDELRFAVLAGDAKTISRAPGIGGKTAQRLIIELKDKLSLDDLTGLSGEEGLTPGGGGPGDSARQEAIMALVSLGYSSSDAARAVRKTKLAEDADSEEILKEALKKLL